MLTFRLENVSLLCINLLIIASLAYYALIPHRLLRIPHSALRIPQRTEPFRTIRCGFSIPHCGFCIAIFGPHSACGTKNVKIILTFKNPIESHPMRNPQCWLRNPHCGMIRMRNAESAMRDAECGIRMRNPQCGIRMGAEVKK